MSGGAIPCGGDDTNALVFDIGHHSMRVGYAQEQSPRHEIPAEVGISVWASVGNSSAAIDYMDPIQYYVDTNVLNVPRRGMEVASYMKDGVIDDWDLFDKVLDYTYNKCIHLESPCCPVLMSESPWNSKINREKLSEIMFEKYHVPAFFLVKNAVLAALANGRTTALVVDSGATHTSAVPVQDGYVLSEALVKSPVGGDYISTQCKQYLQESNIEVVPIYMIGSKIPVKEDAKAIWIKKKNIPEVTMSWHNYMVKKVIQDFQSCVLQVSEETYDESHIASRRIPGVRYEFPNGYNHRFGFERFRIPEVLFDPSVVPVQGEVGGSKQLGVSHLVTNSIGMCDPDVRPALYGSVVVTGGNSLLNRFPERLSKDLSMRIPSNVSAKLISANGSAERRFGSWIGGSIFASSGAFQQMWISSQEYYEEGRGQIHTKCP